MLRPTPYALRYSGRGWLSYLLFLSALILLTLPACASNANAEPTPPVIHYGEDACEFCSTIYVQSAELTTPMLSGLAAFESPEKANVLAAEMQGHVMTFNDVLAYYKANPLPQGEHSMEHDH
ncbi:MAG: hypothetical protein HYR94_03610 [Chloroflexi bacterium]|nr:hypothetical protein [Chloroflexota bacterium]